MIQSPDCCSLFVVVCIVVAGCDLESHGERDSSPSTAASKSDVVADQTSDKAIAPEANGGRGESSSPLGDDVSVNISGVDRVVPTTKYKLNPSHLQFYLEPLEPGFGEYFQVEGEAEQGFSAHPTQIAFGIPDEGKCVVDVEFRQDLPPIDEAVQAVAVPLSVTQSNGIYLRTLRELDEQHHVAVPEGRYDVVARFFQDRDLGEVYWRVVLSFLPGESVGAKCLKMPGRNPATKLILHSDTE